MTVARGAAIGALVLAIVVVGFIFFSRDGGTEYKLRFQTAGQLVKDDDVQIGGRRIGSIKKIELTNNNLAEITIEVEKGYAPLHAGTTATIRASSLSGIANRYIQLTPGPNSAKKLDDGAELTTEKTTTIVDLDQLFDTLDPKTLKGLQNVIQGFAVQYDGRTLDKRALAADEANRSAKYFNPFLSTTDTLVNQIMKDQPTLERFLTDSSELVTSVAAKSTTLTELVSNTNQTAGAIADESDALDTTLAELPTTLRKANTTFVNLRSTLADLTVLVDASKPANKDLAKFLRVLRPLVVASTPTIQDLSTLIRKAGPNNDAIDLLNKTPTLAKSASTTFPNAIKSLRQSQSVIQYIRPYAPEFIMWLRDFGQAASNYDANGHFARISPMFNAFSFTDNPAGGVLTPVIPALRKVGLTTDYFSRCPGAASQPRPDGSNPFLDQGRLTPGNGTPSNPGDCDPSQVPPGP
jgi:phospholipid/cholesterol/gamma-HCH transport system substrate-binding protein